MRFTVMAMSNKKEEVPQQVSAEQSNDNSVVAFSNGATFSLSVYLRRPIGNRNAVLNAPVLKGNQANEALFEGTRLPPKYPEYENYEKRNNSYSLWVHNSPSPTALCEAGFFFTGIIDLVRCYHCGIGLKDFSSEDDPLIEHVRHSGNCSYLLDHLGPTRLADIKRQIDLHDHDLTQGSSQQYRHPKYSTVESRVNSFVSWSSAAIQTPARLADAGFFFTGIDDQVRCFACDGGLRRWDPEDDPWTEHCRWFPTCPYAQAIKGEEFIALVQASTQQEYEPAEDEAAPRLAVSRPHLDPVFRAVLKGYRAQCLEMGFIETDIEEGIQELINRGNSQPQLSEILDAIEITRERRQESAIAAIAHTNETPLEENKRLKRTLMCMFCEKNAVNVLLLPCTHHRLCIECAEQQTVCPVCQRPVEEQIRTFLV